MTALAAVIRERCRIRDIPLSCSCHWSYRAAPHRWARTRAAPGCVWHGGTS